MEKSQPTQWDIDLKIGTALTRKNCAVFISNLLTINRLKKFKHTNEELELAKLQSEKEKKKKQLDQ